MDYIISKATDPNLSMTLGTLNGMGSTLGLEVRQVPHPLTTFRYVYVRGGGAYCIFLINHLNEVVGAKAEFGQGFELLGRVVNSAGFDLVSVQSGTRWCHNGEVMRP